MSIAITAQAGVRPRRPTASTVERFFRYNGLSLILAGLFLATLTGQALTGWHAYRDDLRDHGRDDRVTLVAYLQSGHFVEAVGENWESEFLQMAAFVWLTSFLFQKGSPESKDPDKPEEPDPPVTPDSPWPVRRGGWVAAVYAHSLSLTLLALFAASMLMHAAGGAREYSREQAMHGQPPTGTLAYMGTSQFWFESMQNWQSEFLSIAAMVVLGVFLRERGSPESKSVSTPHAENEE